MADLDQVANQGTPRRRRASRPPVHPAEHVVSIRWPVLRLGGIDPTTIAAMCLVVGGLVTWWLASSAIPLYSMTDLGLASVLPLGVWISFLLVALAFVLALRVGRDPPIVITIVATVIMLHGLSISVEPEMRFSMSWQHVGIADYLLTHGSVDPNLDAYQNWPGFFAFTAFLSATTGLRDLTPVIKWAPVFYNLLYLGPIVAIGRSLLGRTRVVWLAVWLFSVNNWIGQDYFSPQGLHFFAYLVVLAVLLQWFKGTTAAIAPTGPRLFHVRLWAVLARCRAANAPSASGLANAPATASQRVALLGAIFLIFAAMVSSHQITPYALFLTTGALVIVGWCRLSTFPIIILLATLLWTAYLAAGYFAGHGGALVSQLGAITSIFRESLGDRLRGSPGHERIVQFRLAATALLWLLAALGLLRLVRRGRRAALGLAAAAVAPFPLLVLQSYGGETLLRVSLFAMPFMAILAACALAGLDRLQQSWRILATVALIGTIFIASFPFTRYGNERMDWFSTKEVAAVRDLYYLAPKGSVLASVTNDLPWRYIRYDDEYRTLTADPRRLRAVHPPIAIGPVVAEDESIDLGVRDRQLLVDQVVSRMAVRNGQQAYLIITRSQKADLDILGPWSPGLADRMVDILRSSASFRVIIDNGDAIVFRLQKEGALP